MLHFASAGHLPMLIYRPTSGKVYLLNASGSPFGASVNTNLPANGFWDSASEAGAAINGPSVLKSERVALLQNDLLVLYSDGLLAARNASGEVWGRQRLLEFVRTFWISPIRKPAVVSWRAAS
ncbi:MAG: serine/threonine-protein phosphatase [candidate division KSB1 bacterium]|nr:serine/threonine-protein phosphatase [candidate division KSB1 bacterium]MDZ7367452.1 serine/threonine-protein phosphatase [candidate division KSB1 bacterium]MDZ7405443.1 serine/threonine-protein phosphatase [candidate division KSB1 bacterium]